MQHCAQVDGEAELPENSVEQNVPDLLVLDRFYASLHMFQPLLGLAVPCQLRTRRRTDAQVEGERNKCTLIAVTQVQQVRFARIAAQNTRFEAIGPELSESQARVRRV